MRPIRNYLKRRTEAKLQKAEQKRESVRLAFTKHYINFKTLLGLNDEVLEIINELEQAMEGPGVFGMAFVRARCTALSVDIYKIIQNLNEIADGENRKLFAVFDEIRAKIDRQLTKKRPTHVASLVVPLDKVGRETADQTGNKMAYLGEAKNRLRLPVPDGFVITSAAYELFMEKSGLQEEINRQTQFLKREDIAQLHEISAKIQGLILRTPLPDKLEEAILSAYQDLRTRTKDMAGVALRSSALGEDEAGVSFAGQYRSILNVGPESLTLSYKEVVAGKYSAPAITYRINMGFLDEDIAMCVGCMPMVPAAAAGVMYSVDPGSSFPDAVIINAVLGLGKPVVDGTVNPDLYVLEREEPHTVRRKETHAKRHKAVLLEGEGIAMENVDEHESQLPALTDGQARELAEIAMRLEEHFGAPQDIEWALDPCGAFWVLQARPLLVPGEKETREAAACEAACCPKLLEGGVTASPGAACGPAFRVETTVDMLQFPEGAVLVAKNPLPRWAALLHKAAAVVTEQGGITGHLAAVAREFRVPALMGATSAFQTIRTGEVVTVDADGRAIYDGRAESVLSATRKRRSNGMKGTPVYHVLEGVLKHIAPLNLSDPESGSFTPGACRTFHDIIRYAHESALRELFDEAGETPFSRDAARKLVSDVPMDWLVLDLGGGVREGADKAVLGIGDITCEPLSALWRGITAFPWKGPPPLDSKGFVSILVESTMTPDLAPGRESAMAGSNYLIVSGDFFHLNTKLGFHYSTVEAFLGERAAENYVWFYFKGGAADRERKERRGELIRGVLERFDFWTQASGDMISARVERQEKAYMMERLKVLGYILLHTRQLDMVLSDTARVRRHLEEMIKELSSVVEIKPD
jgi:pyruvate,water dikinase